LSFLVLVGPTLYGASPSRRLLRQTSFWRFSVDVDSVAPCCSICCCIPWTQAVVYSTFAPSSFTSVNWMRVLRCERDIFFPMIKPSSILNCSVYHISTFIKNYVFHSVYYNLIEKDTLFSFSTFGMYSLIRSSQLFVLPKNVRSPHALLPFHYHPGEQSTTKRTILAQSLFGWVLAWLGTKVELTILD
jgi:hypothetical protein